MPRIHFDLSFNREYKKFVRKNSPRKKKVEKITRLFMEDQTHPSLNIEKLEGSDIWTIRVDKGNRIFFVWSKQGDTAIFFSIGPHDLYRRL